jgi:hypothetical protein
MWTHHTHRLVSRPAAEVREDIARLVDAAWRRVTTVTTTEHHGRRSDWIASAPGADDVDIVLTWTLSDLGDTTLIVLTLDEFDDGPDPTEALEEILDVVATARRAARW